MLKETLNSRSLVIRTRPCLGRDLGVIGLDLDTHLGPKKKPQSQKGESKNEKVRDRFTAAKKFRF